MERRSIPKKSRRGRFQRKLEKATIAAYARGLDQGRREILGTLTKVAACGALTREVQELYKPARRDMVDGLKRKVLNALEPHLHVTEDKLDYLTHFTVSLFIRDSNTVSPFLTDG